MSVLAPWFLLGGLAIGLPIFLHLLKRENPVRLPFSSLMFFERHKVTTLKQRRLRYRLLFAARLALYALIALAFSKPVWERSLDASLEDIPKIHVLAMDASLSMNYAGRWDAAVAAASGVIDAMDPKDRARLIQLGPGASVVTQALPDGEQLRQGLAALAPGAASNDFGDLVEIVRTIMPEDGAPVDVHVFSDFQAAALPGRFSDLQLPSAAKLVIHNVAEDEAQNWAIESVKGTTKLFEGQQARLEAVIAAFGASDSSRSVSLYLDGQLVDTQSVTIPEFGRATATFQGFDAPAGFSRAELRLSPDDELPEDNVRRVAIDNSDAEPILFVSGANRRRDQTYYSAALTAGSEGTFRVVGASAADVQRQPLEQFALVIVSDVPDLPTQFAISLREYVESGGAALIALGQKSVATGQMPLSDRSIGRAPARQGYLAAGKLDEAHPALRGVERFQGVQFYQRARLATGQEDQILARLADGSPLLVEFALGEGKVLVFASAFDNTWNDFPLHPVFVPFAVESARYLSGLEEGLQQELVHAVLDVGSRGGSTGPVQVFDPQGERALSLAASARGESVELTSVGFYELRRAGETELIAVNADPSESNLRPMDADSLALWEATGRGSSRPAETAPGVPAEPVKPPPIALWRFVLFLLALVALAESVIANWHLPVRREV